MRRLIQRLIQRLEQQFLGNLGKYTSAVWQANGIVFCLVCGVVFFHSIIGIHALQAAPADSLRAIILKAANNKSMVSALNEYSMIIHETYPDSTRYFAGKALNIAESLKDWKGKAQSLNCIGVSYFIQNNYEKALEYYLNALSLREKIGDMKGVAGTLNNVGMVYRDRKEYSTALSYYFRALRINDSLKNTVYYVRNLNNIGVAYENLNYFDSALIYHRRSIALKRTLGDNVGIASTLRNIGRVYIRLKRTADAEQTFGEALKIPSISKQVRAMILLDLAALYEERSNIPTATRYAQEALLLAEELHSALIEQNVCELLARVERQKGQHKQALEYYQRFISLRDSLFGESSTRRLAALQTNYELERQRVQIELLTKEQTLQTFVRNGLIAGFLLLVVLLGVSAVAYMSKLRSNEQLRAINAEILRQQQIVKEQAVEIQLSNTALSEKNVELERTNTSLATLNNEKNEIMGIVAHDLKNPIGAVRGLADMIHTGFAEAAQIPVISEQIVSTADRMLDLVKNLLDVNRLESGRMQFHVVLLHVQPILESTLWQYEATAQQKGLQFHFAADPNTPAILADEQAIMQVLDNIISNAVKYSPHGKNIFVRLKPSNDEPRNSATCNGAVRIEVQDEGQGISPEDMTKLFGKFARLSARPTGGEHSTGLGLSIVKKMVEAMNGKVWCESECGNGEHDCSTGATFIVELPAA